MTLVQTIPDQTILVQMTRDLTTLDPMIPDLMILIQMILIQMILIRMIPVTTMIKVAKMIRRAW